MDEHIWDSHSADLTVYMWMRREEKVHSWAMKLERKRLGHIPVLLSVSSD